METTTTFAKQVLTIEAAKALIGKTIKTHFFGYRGQDGTDEFTVGHITTEWDLAATITQGYEKYGTQQAYWATILSPDRISHSKQRLLLITADGRNTHIFADSRDTEFSCSDWGRCVTFEIVQNA